jgi:hypothetical protein
MGDHVSVTVIATGFKYQTASAQPTSKQTSPDIEAVTAAHATKQPGQKQYAFRTDAPVSARYIMGKEAVELKEEESNTDLADKNSLDLDVPAYLRRKSVEQIQE